MKLQRQAWLSRMLFGIAMSAAVLGQTASAAIIADFKTDFQTTTPATGWAYEWNQLGPIGTAANYVPLQYDSGGNWYIATPGTFPNYTVGAGYDVVASGFMHPGPGSTQVANETYAIAAFTLPAGGTASVVNLLVNDGDTNGGDGVNVWVGVNNSGSIVGSYANGGSFAASGIALGNLNASDTIYVAIGSKANDGNDSTLIEFQVSLVPVPEPATIGLLGLGLAGLVAFARRRRA